jgi:hypothetical protein
MAIYRSKPRIVDAEQWLGPQSSPMRGVYVDGNTDNPANYHCFTAQRVNVSVMPGDWIILETEQDSSGTIWAYPCDPKVFAANYEAVQI